MAQINFTIPDDKIQTVIDAMKWVTPKEPGYTDNQWAKEAVRRWVVTQVENYQQFLAAQAITPDNTIIS